MVSFKNFYNMILEKYSAIVLDNSSHERIINNPEVIEYLSPEHELMAHHMTIKMGGLEGTEYFGKVGSVVNIIATHIGRLGDGSVVALRVRGGYSMNKVPHITVGVDRSRSKPKDSNSIVDWVPLKVPIELNGSIEEVL